MALFFHLQTQQCHISLMGLQSQVGFIYFKKHSDNSEWCLFKVLIHECMKHCHLRQFFKNSLQYILIIFIFPCFQDSSPFPTPNTAVSFFFNIPSPILLPIVFHTGLSLEGDQHNKGHTHKTTDLPSPSSNTLDSFLARGEAFAPSNLYSWILSAKRFCWTCTSCLSR